jgi:exopolysaccharide biosynthesis WecB/TagA/CpsF family protein
MSTKPPPAAWPPRHAIFGVTVSATDYSGVTDAVIHAARRREGGVVDFMPVHGLVTAARQAGFRRMVNTFEIVAPDGQPVRWALNRMHDANLRDRVYGPELMLRLCAEAAKEKIGIYLYGGRPEVLEKLKANLQERHPSLKIAGAEAPPFRPLTAEEDEAVVERINASGAGIVFLGIGCPKQEAFAFEHRARIGALMLCVGAAFDLHAGVKRMAPRLMQRLSLEWLYRLWQEPRRLWRRYFVTNSMFILLVAAHCLRNRGFAPPGRAPAVGNAVSGAA